MPILNHSSFLFVFCRGPKAVLLLKGERHKIAVSETHSQLHHSFPHIRFGQCHLHKLSDPLLISYLRPFPGSFYLVC